jgi:DNA-binding response OmpR family regulator
MVSAVLNGTILIIEDDKKTAALVELYLEREGFKTLTAHNGRSALELARDRNPIFIILDLMLPLMDGWEVCRQLRRFSEVPILILTARDEEIDRVTGLTIGADDYMVKPFSPRELVARVKAILRRYRTIPGNKVNSLEHNGLILDLEKHNTTLNGVPLFLTLHEFKILQALMSAPGRVFSRNELLEHIYPKGEATVIDRVIDVHIGKLRQKIEVDPSRPCYILTIRGLGYKFNE